MPLNEASRKPKRDRWPLEFDLTGVPHDSAERTRLLQEKRTTDPSFASVPSGEEQEELNMNRVTNSFTVDKPIQGAEITDINNPPHRNYNPYDPKNEFPKMLYHHDSGRVLKVNDAKEQKAALKRNFKLEPSPTHDYSKVNRAGIAAVAEHGEKREEEMSAEELAALDEEESA